MADALIEPPVELLFFDTFSHEDSEDLNLDLVRFPCPVLICEVRVVPLGTQVQADLPGGSRRGATNPSSFKLELFVNNLGKPNASTFEQLGQLDYKENVTIQLKPEEDIATDGLILKGWYSTITLAVYGCETTVVVKPERASPPPPPPLPSQQTVTRPKTREGHHEPETRPTQQPQQQHPLDFIQEQVERQIQQQKQQQQQQQQQQQIPQPVPPAHITTPQPVPPPHQVQPPQSTAPSHPVQPPQQVPPPQTVHTPQAVPPPQSVQPPQPVPVAQPVPSAQTGPGPVPSSADAYRPAFDHPPPHPHPVQREVPHEFPPIPTGPSPIESLPAHESRGSVDFRSEVRESPRDFRDFPPEPKEPYSGRDAHEDSRSRDSYDDNWDYRSRSRSRRSSRDSDTRDSRDFSRSSSREGSQDSQDHHDRSREYRDYRERERERTHREDRERDKIKERDRSGEFVEKEGRPRTPTMPARRRSFERSRSRSPPGREPIRPPEPPPPDNEDMESGELLEEGLEEIYENLSPDTSPLITNFSDGEIPEGEDAGYEDISSEDDFTGEDTDVIPGFDIEDIIDDSWEFTTPVFNPLQCYLSPLGILTDPSLTPFEQEMLSLESQQTMDCPEEATALSEIVKQFAGKEKHEKWVEALEEVPNHLVKGLSYLLVKEKKQDLLNQLIDWTMDGLDLDQAMVQPESAFKVRHLKMGIRLSGCLCSLSSNITNKLLVKEVQHKLIDLFVSPYMAFSIKLHILKALDQTIYFTDGIRWLLGTHLDQEPKSEKQHTCYQRILDSMLSKQLSCTTAGLSSLLTKIHTYELFNSLSEKIDTVLRSLPSVDDEDSVKSKEEQVADSETGLHTPALDEKDVDLIVTCLTEVCRVFVHAEQLIAQSKTALPSSTVFEKSPPATDPYPGLYTLAYSCNLLESLFVLTSTPALCCHLSIFSAVQDILQHLIKSQSGLLFLSSKPDTTNGIIRSLIQAPEENAEDVGSDETAARQLGLELVYHLQVLQYVDHLMDYHKKNPNPKNTDASEPLGILQNLFSMTFTSVTRDGVPIVTTAGRDAVVYVLSLEDNLKILFPFLELTGDQTVDRRRKKSVCTGYATQLLCLVVKMSTNIKMLEKYKTKLIAISEEDINSRVSDLQNWLAPMVKLTTITHNDLTAVIGQMKQYMDDVQKLPPALITTLRILHTLVISPQTKFPQDQLTELKYKYALLEMYSEECFPILLGFLQKLSESLLRPWQQGLRLNNEQLMLHLAIIQPSLAIVRKTLCELIGATGREFKDLTALPVLFELYTVTCSVPLSLMHSQELSKIQKEIIDCILAYTQPTLDPQAQTEDALSQSLWTKTVGELLKYTVKMPYAYLSGLLILSEILPLPLPLQSKQALTEEEISAALNSRKLWSAHLHPLTPQLTNIIETLAGSSCQPVQHMIRRVCCQLADLAAPTSTMLTKCFVDILLSNLNCKKESEGSEEKKEGDAVDHDGFETLSCTQHVGKVFNLLAYLMSQPAIKTSMLDIIRGSLEEENYSRLLPCFLQMLNHVSDKPAHNSAQECIVSILLNLCDPEITLVSPESKMSLPEQLANSLPGGENLSLIVNALLEHISNRDHSYATILPCVRTLVMLTDHDYGFYHVYSGLKKISSVFNNLLIRINNTFSKDSSDCLSTLSTSIEFLRLLVVVESSVMDLSFTRTYTLTTQQLAEVLSWQPGIQHPLDDLEKLLEECAKEEESIDSLVESIHSLMKVLREAGSEEERQIPEVTLPSPEPLSELFNQRVVFVIADVEQDRLSPTYWLGNPALEEPDQEPDLIGVNLEEMCSRYFPDFALEFELKKDCSLIGIDVVRPRRPKGDRRRSHEMININRGRRGGRPFVAPMRGRGLMSQNRSDPFRSRPPNTSRPPSMHVDDFIKMEKNRSHSPSPQQQHIQSTTTRRIDKDTSPYRGRGRGGFPFSDRGRGGFSTRGKFFTPPPSYGPPEHMQRGAMTSYRGDRGKFSPRGFYRGSYDPRPNVGERGGTRNARFSPRGRAVWTRESKDNGNRFPVQGRREFAGRHIRSFTK